MSENHNHCSRCDHGHNQEQLVVPKDIFLIIISLILFVFGMIFKERLHDTPFSVGEYGIFLIAYFLCG